MANSAVFERLALNAPHLTSKQFIPALVYGTAWKKDATATLVYQALSHGFTGIDTACQPKHYREDLVGAGLRQALADGVLKRSDVYVQTKYTSLSGQDPDNIPYDPKASITEQVKASVAVSLKNLRSGEDETSASDGNSYLDALVLHSPLKTIDETMEAWHTLEKYVPSQIRSLGVSNCNIHTLMDIYERATIKPAVLQNRFYPNTKFDIGIRKFCREKAIIYQSFWTLTANPGLVFSPEVGSLANQTGISEQAALYAMVLGLGNTVILDGTKKVQTMKEDHVALVKVKEFAEKHEEEWKALLSRFKSLIGEPKS
jgi:diketogulonate reductase-like aldo/keto reductase